MTVRTFFVTAALGAAFASPAAGGVLYVDVDATGADDGSSWADAYVSLQSALDAAWFGDDVWVAEGTYYPSKATGEPDPSRAVSFELVLGVAMYGGFDGTETTREQRDWEAHETILSCDLGDNDAVLDPSDFLGHPSRADNCYHVLIARVGTSVVDGFTVTSGQADAMGLSPFVWPCCGGGLFSEASASPTLRNCKFTYNLGAAEGGAIVHRGQITIIDSEFIAGYSIDGGGIYSGPPVGLEPEVPVSGGLIRGSSFEGNVAFAEGGAFFTFHSKNVYENCRIVGNVSNFNGGAASLFVGSTLIRNCLIADNSALGEIGTAGGGAIRVIGSVGAGPGGDHELVNVTVVHNHTNNRGGGLNQHSPSVTTTNPTFVTITNSIFWGNTADPGSGEEVYIEDHSAVEFRYSLVQGGIGTDANPGPRISKEFLGFLGNANEVTGDPELTVDYQLGSSSDAIDAGDPARSYLGQVDVDGEARVMGACTPLPDLGSDEAFYPECWNSVSNCLGDVDQDGLVSPLDWVAWSDALSHSQIADSTNACGDVNRDGLLNASDASIIGLGQFTAPSSCSCGAAWPLGN